MICVNRRDAMRMVAAGLAAAVGCGAVVATDADTLGNGACTKCQCPYYMSSPNKTCSNPYCKHPYDAHKRIHPPQAEADLEPATATATATYCVSYVHYKKSRGIVTKIGGGKVGPYSTRQEAQSVADDYNANDRTVNGVRYYYEARVTGCNP